MLALSSYKMKRFGECLFAVSKAAGAIQRQEKNLSDNISKRRRSSHTSFDLFHFAKNTSTRNKNGAENEEQTSFDCQQNEDRSSYDMFDADGNLTRLGLVQLFYLKAKCLCKLERYSESLFQLAKIN